MKWEGFAQRLADAFRVPREGRLAAAVVRHGRVDLRELAETSEELAAEDERETVRRRWPLEPLIGFGWGGPVAQPSVGLYLLDTGGPCVFVCLSREDLPLTVRGAVGPKNRQAPFCRFLLEGRVLDECFESMPTELANHRPDLLPARVVKRALDEWLARSERAGRASWPDVWMDIHTLLPAPEALARWLAKLRSRIARAAPGRPPGPGGERVLPDAEARRLVLELHFALVYRELSPPRGPRKGTHRAHAVRAERGTHGRRRPSQRRG